MADNMEVVLRIVIFSVYFSSFCGSTVYHIQESRVPCHPCHVHISYGNSISDVTVIWATEETCNSSLSYGTDPWSYQTISDIETIHLEKAREDGLHCIYRAVIKDLLPNTTYFYRPVSGGISSGPHFFRTPSSGQNASPEFLICGDHGGNDIDRLPYLDDEILSGQYDAVLHVGEFSKEAPVVNNEETEDNDTAICYPRSGDMFMTLISNMASRVPHLTTPGFHVSGDLFTDYRNWFSTPNTQWPIPLENMWYSFDIGPIHFISYSTEVYYLDNEQYASKQNDWLVQDLITTSINRSQHPWIIAFGHRPMYCSDSLLDCSKTDSKVRTGLENTFFTYGVDLVIQAYGSSYERLYPHYKGQVVGNSYTNPKAPIQIITGTSGTQTTSTPPPVMTKNTWSAIRLDDLNSFSRLKVYNSSHLSWELVSSKDKTVLDHVWIVTDHHGAFIAPLPPPKPTTTPTPIVVVPDDPNKATDDTSAASSNNVPSTDQSRTFQTFIQDTSNQVLIGVGIAVVTLILIISVVIIVKKKQRIRSYRRWDATVDYGRKFYSSYSQVGKDDKDGSDFEVDSTEGNASSKLLTEK